MNKFKFLTVISCCLLFQGIIATGMAQDTINQDSNKDLLPGAEVLETGLLQNVAGYRGDVLGAEIISVTLDEKSLTELTEISIPLDPELADRVSVFFPSGKRMKLNRPLEISMDHENNKVGIIMSLPRKSRVGFIIRLTDLPEE